MLRRIANAVEAIVALALVLTIVLLFTNDPTPVGSTPGVPRPSLDAYGLPADAVATNAPLPVVDAASIYGQQCAACHGAAGEGGVGPALADGRTVERYPDAADQVAVVADGRGAMPAFADRLTSEEIESIVDFVRNDLVSP